MDKIELGPLSSIIQFRERLRNATKEVKPGGTVLLKCLSSDVGPVLRSVIEETGLQFWRAGDALGEFLFGLPLRDERWEYAFEAAEIKDIPADWKCLDVGSGRFTWPRANAVCDSNPDMRQHARPGQEFSEASVTERLPYDNKQFDFATCFHVLEHVNDPAAAARELTRVAKAGLVECPHPVKEGLMLFLESDHRWFVLPASKPGGALRFFKIDKTWHEAMQDPEAQGAAYRTFINNTDKTGDRAILRNYFARVEAGLNVIHRWDDELKVEVHT